MPIDESREFHPMKLAVVTVSDTRTEKDDTSGQYLFDAATEAGHEVVFRKIIRDEQAKLEALLRELIADEGVDAIVTTGGTGLTARDITPEAFANVWEKEIAGFGELFRMLSYQTVGTSAIQSRACAGMANATFLFALPGSTGACRDGWEGILKFQLDVRHRPCSFPGLQPRLRAERDA